MPIAPNEELRNIAQSYVDSCGLFGLPRPMILQGHYIQNNEEEHRAIASAYETLPVLDDKATTFYCYAMLRKEIVKQYNFLVKHGYAFSPWRQSGQPYRNSTEMCKDVRTNKHLYYFTGGEVHPFLQGENELLRCVHDIFGHATEGYQFGRRGEVNAWIHHSMMFTTAAQRALTTETHGQNSWTNYGPYSGLPVTERPYAAQKVALLPVTFCDWHKWL
jgi:hypothetical protein